MQTFIAYFRDGYFGLKVLLDVCSVVLQALMVKDPPLIYKCLVDSWLQNAVDAEHLLELYDALGSLDRHQVLKCLAEPPLLLVIFPLVKVVWLLFK
jgi:predicted nucleic acid-binding protein